MRSTGFVVVPVDPDATTLVLHVDLDSGIVSRAIPTGALRAVIVPYKSQRVN